MRPFFCQVEAVETIIWLAEVARRERRYARFWEHIRGASEQANPELLRIAMKMATGSGKTTVVAMLIAWQVVNAVRSPASPLFSRGFLIVTPGITIRDRLRVLLPEDPDSYYRTRELLPADMLGDMARPRSSSPTITPSSAARRWTCPRSAGRSCRAAGRAPETIETEGQMLQRACGELLALKNVVVIDDEAHRPITTTPRRPTKGQRTTTIRDLALSLHRASAHDQALTFGQDDSSRQQSGGPKARRLML